MTLQLAVCLAAVSIFVSITALLLERLWLPRAHSIRWIWIAALCVVFLIPAVGLLTPRHATADMDGIVTSETPPSGQLQGATNWRDLRSSPSVIDVPSQWNRATAILWIGSSGAALLWIVGFHWMLATRMQRAKPAQLFGEPVLICEGVGPAVIGWLRPRVVIPQWVLKLPPPKQRQICRHEFAHVRAGDHLAIGVGLMLVAVAPWNPLLWWQLRRLRIAIEIDCDRRVIAGGVDATEYASTLLDCSIHCRNLHSWSAAMAASVSTLERRIEAMTTPKLKQWSVTATLLLIAAAASAFAAVQIPAPSAGVASESHSAQQRYAGYYAFSPLLLFRVSANGGQLTGAFGHGPDTPLVSIGPDQFRFTDSDATLRFSMDERNQTANVILSQNGANTNAPQIDLSAVESIQESIRSHIASHRPTSGSEAAVRRLIDGIRSGTPDYSSMSAQMAGGTRKMLPEFQKSLQALGTIKEIRFQGINDDGWDQFVVQHQTGASSWQVAVDKHGTLVGALWHEGV